MVVLKNMSTLLYLTQIPKGTYYCPAHGTLLNAMGQPGWEEFGGEIHSRIQHVHVWLSPFPVHLKLSQGC